MKNKYKNICGIVLAGGKNSRYKGKDKTFLKIEQQTFYDKIIHILGNIFDELIVITNSPDDFPKDNIPKHEDIIKDIGPLGGIHTALSKAKGADAIFIVAIDMPFINEEIIRKMATIFTQQDVDILIPKIKNNIEPLHAIYSTGILEKLNDYLKTTNVFSIRSFFKNINTKFFELEDTLINKRFFLNINSQDDYDKYIQSFSTLNYNLE